jgi:excisionase family DNA binding protein
LPNSAQPHEPSQNEPYITSSEAARILGRSTKTVSRWARQGRLPHLITLGGHRRFPAGAVNELARKLRAE